jgi:hypothetical protein
VSVVIKQDQHAYAFVDNEGVVYVDTVSSAEHKAMINAMVVLFGMHMGSDSWTPARIIAHWNLLFAGKGRIVPIACIQLHETRDHDQQD